MHTQMLDTFICMSSRVTIFPLQWEGSPMGLPQKGPGGGDAMFHHGQLEKRGAGVPVTTTLIFKIIFLHGLYDLSQSTH